VCGYEEQDISRKKKKLSLKIFLVASKIIVSWGFEMVGLIKYVCAVNIIEIDFLM
jgi:hypothetical protein